VKPFLLCALLALAAPLAGAADAPPQRALTLMDLSDLAASRNPSTRVAWAQVRASQAAEALARAGYWPVLSGALQVQRSQSIANEGAQIAAQTRYAATLNFSYLIFDFGARGGALARAQADALAARYTADRALQDLTLEVESAYYAVIGTRAVEEASREALEQARANEDAARQRQAVGTATIADLYQAQAALASATLDVQRAEGARVIADGALAVAAGYSPDSTLTLSPWQTPDQPQLPVATAAELMQSAHDARADLLAAKAREQSAEAAVRVARAGWFPSLGALASAGRTKVAGRGTTQQYSAALRLDVPIFSGFSTRAAIDQAQAELDLASATTDQLRASVEQAVWVAFQNVQTARKSIDASRAQRRAAEAAADVIRARYKNGLATIIEVLTIESTLAQARVAEIQAGIDWATALAALGHDAGGLTIPVSGETP
jgi:outer membrane protein